MKKIRGPSRTRRNPALWNVRGLARLLLLLALAVPAGAIINGTHDTENQYPYVGFATDLIGGCSGSAISPTLFITAAHCFDDESAPTNPPRLVFVDFSNRIGQDPISTTGLWIPHPDFCIGCDRTLPGFDTHDFAVVVLDEPVDLPRYALLPTEGLADTLPNHTPITHVGYGVDRFTRGGGPPERVFDFLRRIARAELIASHHRHASEYLKFSANPARGKGTICFGDSGGPNLLGETDVILSINSYGTENICKAPSYSNRIDLAYALEFITSFIEE